jgi:hypothetical protein
MVKRKIQVSVAIVISSLFASTSYPNQPATETLKVNAQDHKLKPAHHNLNNQQLKQAGDFLGYDVLENRTYF